MNWFIFYALPRTFSNSLETYLTIFAFYYWPFPNAISKIITPQHSKNRRIALIFSSIACIIRITNGVIWIPLILREFLLLIHLGQSKLLKLFIFDIIIIAVLSISALITIDSIYYGEFTITPLNFYYFNNTLNGSSLYGTHPFYWYFINGLPTIIGTMTPSIFYSLQFIVSNEWNEYGLKLKKRINPFGLISKILPLFCCLWTVMIFSFNPHKEYRFILPILPILLIYCGLGLFYIFNKYGNKVMKYILFIILTTNGFAALYLCTWHQHAPISVLNYLSNDIYTNVKIENYNDINIEFILSCHSTPFYSYLHLNGDKDNHPNLKQLDCSPRFNKDNILTRDETESWYLEVNPKKYFKQKLSVNYEQNGCPSYMIISSHHFEFAENVINQCQYTQLVKFSDNYFQDKYLIIFSNIPRVST